MANERLEDAVQRAAEGDSEAFAEIVGKTIIPLRAYISFYLADWSLVDDVLQETYFRIFRKIESYKPGSNFLAWAKAIAKYEALTERKRKVRQGARDRCLSLMTTRLIDEMESSEDDGLLEKKLRALHVCLKKLGGKIRALIEKRYLEGMSLKDAAQACAVKPASAGVAIHRSRTTLAACVQKALDGMRGSDDETR